MTMGVQWEETFVPRIQPYLEISKPSEMEKKKSKCNSQLETAQSFGIRHQEFTTGHCLLLMG